VFPGSWTRRGSAGRLTRSVPSRCSDHPLSQLVSDSDSEMGSAERLALGSTDTLSNGHKADLEAAKRLAKRLYNLDGFKKADVARHLGKKYVWVFARNDPFCEGPAAPAVYPRLLPWQDPGARSPGLVRLVQMCQVFPLKVLEPKRHPGFGTFLP